MPKCKNCGRQIPKSDKDICRYCGQRNPFDPLSTETQDITQFIDFDPNLAQKFNRKSLKTYSFLLMFLGIFGAHYFYIQKVKEGILSIIFNLLFIGGAGALLMLAGFSSNCLPIYWVISFAILFVIYIVIGIIVMFKGEVVDHDGQQLE